MFGAIETEVIIQPVRLRGKVKAYQALVADPKCISIQAGFVFEYAISVDLDSRESLDRYSFSQYDLAMEPVCLGYAREAAIVNQEAIKQVTAANKFILACEDLFADGMAVRTMPESERVNIAEVVLNLQKEVDKAFESVIAEREAVKATTAKVIAKSKSKK